MTALLQAASKCRKQLACYQQVPASAESSQQACYPQVLIVDSRT
jgi:hypothetical protein